MASLHQWHQTDKRPYLLLIDYRMQTPEAEQMSAVLDEPGLHENVLAQVTGAERLQFCTQLLYLPLVGV